MASPLLLVLILISLAMMPTPNVAESPAEAYWKLKFGNETDMPKIVKDALIGSDENAKLMIQKGFFTITKEVESSSMCNTEDHNYSKAFNNTVEDIDPTKHSIFFIESDLIHPGKTFNLNFMKIEDNAKFLPVQVAESIPFSSKNYPQILNLFSAKPHSTSAVIMEDTIEACEKKAMEFDEMKLCALTLEDMVDYAISYVGQSMSTVSGYVDRNIQDVHTVLNAKKIESDGAMFCHKICYPYAVFYCHKPKETNLYDISMVDLDGKIMNAIGVCHANTAFWAPKHYAFQMLKVKPGTVPICHFLNERSIAFVPK